MRHSLRNGKLGRIHPWRLRKSYDTLIKYNSRAAGVRVVYPENFIFRYGGGVKIKM